MKIFITPWVDLTLEQIEKCIEAGARMARIHTGKANISLINELIGFYSLKKFRFDLDLRGNKPNTELIDGGNKKTEIKMGDKVIFYTEETAKPLPKCDHYIKINFFPEIIKSNSKGNLNVDDGAILFEINRVTQNNGQTELIETIVTEATQPFIYPGDGISSTNIYIHSRAKCLLTDIDINILKSVADDKKKLVKLIAVSFCEEGKLIIQAEKIIAGLGYRKFQIIPKIETLRGVTNLYKICFVLRRKYGDKAELQIGRNDLNLDCIRNKKQINYHDQVDKIIEICKKNRVKVGVLALVLPSVRKRHKINRNSNDYDPSKEEMENILHLKQAGADYLGLTNDDYIDHPEKMVKKLNQIINKNE